MYTGTYFMYVDLTSNTWDNFGMTGVGEENAAVLMVGLPGPPREAVAETHFDKIVIHTCIQMPTNAVS